MASFLRPYTPEVVGWLSNWAPSRQLRPNGQYARFHILAESSRSSGRREGPRVTQNLRPKPGEPVGQPWEDAYGDGLR